MNYTMTTPCEACPFLKGSGFTYDSLVAHSSGEFACHKACKVDEDEGTFVPRNDNTPHCAGALIFNELRSAPHQMARICERLGLYKPHNLNMKAKIGSRPSDYRTRER
jgi:hypothetical protein